jgi:hypothetical protein
VVIILDEKNKTQVSSLNYMIFPGSSAGCAIVEAVIYRLLTMGTRVQSRIFHVGFVMDRMPLGQVILGVLKFSLTSNHYTSTLYYD